VVGVKSRKCVLVVEDDFAVRAALTDLLRSEGVSVAAVENGKQALRYLKPNARPCLILLDMVMPEMDGQTFKHVLDMDHDLDDIPVIIMSADSRRQSARALKPLAFVPKPIDIDRLMALVESVC
jgi:CheY-like chemotaxis protein